MLYPIKSGDTISELSDKFDVDELDIRMLNDIDNPRALKVGELINIPHTTSAPKNTTSTEKKNSKKSWNPKEEKYLKLGVAKSYVGEMDWPITGGGKLTSQFGRRWLTFHEGVDISMPIGTPLYAAHDAIVVYSGSGMSGYGNIVVLKGGGILSVYAHNDRNYVEKGEKVWRGERIATVGQTGKAKGPHVHFEIRIKDEFDKHVAVNPLLFYPDMNF